ncbi:hypothetical protein JHK82_050795 [Glycine max]|nr:hypothetical protein JHK87_050474 [Glycine soja]KAG4936575.1 hypothetical protein JHK85_051494 [Glycine max]KAG5092017.1 hypothetical protein JHK82_050795 [Glycine max]KAG5095103.1 hypothetical protein JHK84_050691 [Glycine max]
MKITLFRQIEILFNGLVKRRKLIAMYLNVLICSRESNSFLTKFFVGCFVTVKDAFVTALRKAEQFLWAGSKMDSVRDMVKNLIEAQKWAKVNLEFIDELLKFTPAPCNEPLYHKLKRKLGC